MLPYPIYFWRFLVTCQDYHFKFQQLWSNSPYDPIWALHLMWVHYTFWKFQWVLWVQNSCQFTVNTANKKVAWIYLSEHRISSKKQPENAAFSSNQPKNMIFFSKRPFLELQFFSSLLCSFRKGGGENYLILIKTGNSTQLVKKTLNSLQNS